MYMFDVIANENGTHFLIQKQYVFDFSLNLIQEKNFIYFSEEASLWCVLRLTHDLHERLCYHEWMLNNKRVNYKDITRKNWFLKH